MLKNEKLSIGFHNNCHVHTDPKPTGSNKTQQPLKFGAVNW